jgi:hypothetical protein
MRRFLQTITVSSVLLLAGSTADAQISFGVQIGEPPPPRAYRVPRQPGPDYVWVEGYWFPEGNRYQWHEGYWTRSPYEGAYWVQPYHDGRQYYPGRWEGPRGNVDHDHRWDRGRQRDERRDPRRDERNKGNERRDRNDRNDRDDSRR